MESIFNIGQRTIGLNRIGLIMQGISRGKKQFSEIIHLKNISLTIFAEFHQTSKIAE